MLTDEEVEKHLIRISSGLVFEYIGDVIFLFKYPSNKIKLKADIIYEKEYKEAISDGLLSMKDLEALISKRNLFTEDDQKKLDKLNSKLDAQTVLLARTTVVKANQDRIKNIISGLRNEINELSYKRTSRLAMSADIRANEEKSLYLCWACTYNEDEQLYWKTYKEFKDTTDIVLRDKIITSFLRYYAGLPSKDVRYIARHNLWRIRYVNSQKVSESLFGVPSAEYTSDMLSLAYWSNYYDNIYQMMPGDRPSDIVIDDDESLDAYMKTFYDERNREGAARRSKHKTPGKLSAFDQEEVIVTASNELYRDIQYDKPKEAQKLRERADIKKRTKRG